jgi:E3 ubiquitin-protein ligase synoviolin
MNYGIPLHILRDVWMTFRSFISRCSDLVRYRRATRDMDAQYPDATEEDVGRLGDRVCIICREEMVVRGGAHAQQHGQGSTPHPQPDASAGSGGLADGPSAGQAIPTDTPTPTTTAAAAATAQADSGGPNETPKKLICGHVFHFHCLRSWLERQQSCPTW